MANRKLVIIGGGLAGLSAGCYALRNDYQTTIVEHNVALGGVCTAWERPPYLIDGCIHWLTGGPFQRFYEELEILPAVGLRVLKHWSTYRDARDGFECAFQANLDALFRQLTAIAPEDSRELERLRDGARDFKNVAPPAQPAELMSLSDGVRMMWGMRGLASTYLHFRKPIDEWAREHLHNWRLQRMFTRMFPPGVPALFLLMVLGYLEQGHLSRPIGGTAAFRDALIASYRRRGGEERVHTTVDEILVRGDRVRGVRFADGSELEADLVISTASAPETVLRLLGGSYEAAATRERLAKWSLVDPIVLASFGVENSYEGFPGLMNIDRLEHFEAGGRSCETMYLRVCNDDPCYAPVGHSVVQALVPTDYDWWAMRGTRYNAEKDAIAAAILTQLEPHFAGIRSAVRVIDVSTPLTFWGRSRAWRGAYEGWIPSRDDLYAHVHKKLGGLHGLYMAGQWVEPGGGVPMAIMSGRQAVELVCHDAEEPFVTD
ncbi:MAG TPA: NAD(P)/FAD-dependent oxidoreductase [Polyangiales bacterium]|nr:NAD(P)/FAD-dependent oxidoreductase [Polyangiales bacterium]